MADRHEELRRFISTQPAPSYFEDWERAIFQARRFTPLGVPPFVTVRCDEMEYLLSAAKEMEEKKGREGE